MKIQITDLHGNVRGVMTIEAFKKANGFTGQCFLSDYVTRFNQTSTEARAQIVLA
jgi:hypothetical protein